VKAIACAPVFRLDDDGSIIGPSNNVFATPSEQVTPGVVLVSIELLNLVLHWGTREAVYEKYAQRAADRERIATARAWLAQPDASELTFCNDCGAEIVITHGHVCKGRK
jgi:hypothetical protein